MNSWTLHLLSCVLNLLFFMIFFFVNQWTYHFSFVSRTYDWPPLFVSEKANQRETECEPCSPNVVEGHLGGADLFRLWRWCLLFAVLELLECPFLLFLSLHHQPPFHPLRYLFMGTSPPIPPHRMFCFVQQNQKVPAGQGRPYIFRWCFMPIVAFSTRFAI